MRADPAASDVAQRMCKPLGENLYASFRYVVRGITRRARDALFGTRVDDSAGRALIDHLLREALYAIDHTPEIDIQHTSPATCVFPRAAAWRGAGIVHEHGNV